MLYLAPLAPLATLIALAAADGAAAQGYVPFMQPLPAWDVWYLLAVPLCAAVSVVYKSIRCRSMRKVPREARVLDHPTLPGCRVVGEGDGAPPDASR